MNEIQIDSLQELTERVSQSGRRALYRGVERADYELLPSLGRMPDAADRTELTRIEARLMFLFKTHAPPFLDALPRNHLEWLAVAQHYGLPTRLLDWTLNPLAGAFFAVRGREEGDCAVYVFTPEAVLSHESAQGVSAEYLGAHPEVLFYVPTHPSSRVAAQRSVFSVHPTPWAPFDDPGLGKLVIPGEVRGAFREALHMHGIDDFSIFPDLEGLSRYLLRLVEYPP